MYFFGNNYICPYCIFATLVSIKTWFCYSKV